MEVYKGRVCLKLANVSWTFQLLPARGLLAIVSASIVAFECARIARGLLSNGLAFQKTLFTDDGLQ